MSKRGFFVLAVPVVLLIAVAVALWYCRPRKVVVTLDVNGAHGLAILGKWDVDGTTGEKTATVPTQFVLPEGCRVTYWVINTEKDVADMRVRYSINGTPGAFSGAGDPPIRKGVRGWVRSGWAWQETKHWIENYDPDDKAAGWLSPPPP
jgi:hypothetical protein